MRLMAVSAVMVCGMAWAQEALVLDIQGRPYDDQLTFACLQGLVNREGPRLFLLTADTDERWIEYYRDRFGVKVKEAGTRVEEAGALGREFAKGLVVWDPEAPDTAHIAATYASLDDLLPVSPRQLEAREEYGALFDGDVRQNLRGRFDGQSKAEVYQWVLDELYPRCGRACLFNGNTELQVRLDLSRWTEQTGTVYLRFGDATEGDGMGAKLNRVKVIRGRETLVDFRTGTSEEAARLSTSSGSWFDPERDRIADREQFFVYRLDLGKGPAIALCRVRNQYLIRVSTTPNGPWETLAENRSTYDGGVTNDTRDYVVAHRGVHIDLSSSQETPEERALKGRFLEGLERFGYVLGWQTMRDSEALHVGQSSEHGKLVMCSMSPNFSFHQHIGAAEPFRQPGKIDPEKVVLDRSKVYVSFALSDGDALHWVGRFQGKQWLMPERGKAPFGWEVQPLLSRIGPGMAQYYYETATPNDCLMAAVSGVGYIYPDLFPAADLPDYLRLTKETMARCDQSVLVVLPASSVEDSVADRYCEALGGQVYGCQEGYAQHRGEKRLRNGVGWLPTLLPRWDHWTREKMLEDFRRLAREMPERPAFIPVHVFCYATTVADCAWLTEQLEREGFDVVRPDELFVLFRKAAEGTVALTTPPDLTLIAGARNRLACLLRSFRTEETQVEVAWELPPEIGGKATGKESIPAEGRAMAGPEVMVPAEAAGRSGKARVTLRYGGQEVVRELPVRIATAPGDKLPPGVTVSQAAVYEVEDLPKQLGEEGPDAEALNGQARCAETKLERPLYLSFGPYDPGVTPGKYVAVFRLKVGDHTGEGLVAAVDAAHAPGLRRAEAVTVRPRDFAAADRYQEFYVPFERVNEGTMEYRVLYMGGPRLCADRVTVFRVE